MTDIGVKGRQVVVIGLGASGLAAVRVLLDEGARVRVTESQEREALADAAEAAEATGADVMTGGHRPEHLDGADLVVTSPGVPEHAEVLRMAAHRGVPVWSELELGARVARVPYVAVTGTNGKTTTIEMIADVMRQAGLDAVACGNVGYPFSLAASGSHDVLAVEASSFQLRFHQSFHPRVSVILNLAPDHLDWHGSMGAYADAKRRVYERQGDGDTHVGNRDDRHAAALSTGAPCSLAWFTLQEPSAGETGYVEGELVARFGAEHHLGRPEGGPALLADAAAAATAAIAFGIDPSAIEAGLRSFRPMPHRGEVVAEVGGIRFIDDSKATNPHAALAAIGTLDRVVLVAGGRSKGVDLSPLAGAARQLVAVVTLGEAAPALAAVFDGRVPVHTADSIEAAVRTAHALAPSGGTVLLAPACSSQDMFRDYGERGDRFAATVRALAGEVQVRG
ncbi:MAG TPA: UDP-N-acetylmuramoyl-L-alanine--D-glutamate ligase [Actinomycetota bacterium]|nr:UDP-N-acetylmuramoyl-L-alanine--D-glutamate ligase [Actinomycetota bacterium]